jgi:hypothetical protein
MRMSTPLHDADFYTWTREQAALLSVAWMSSTQST